MECWGPLVEAGAPSTSTSSVSVADGSGTQEEEDEEEKQEMRLSKWEFPMPCQENCSCCFLPISSIRWSEKIPHENGKTWDPASPSSASNLESLE